jgi:3-methyladenine DNA glycosylase AlkD
MEEPEEYLSALPHPFHAPPVLLLSRMRITLVIVIGQHSLYSDMKEPDQFAGIMKELQSMANPANREGMSWLGINVSSAIGVPMSTLHRIAKEIGRDHDLAARPWESGVHEARILACLIDEPKLVTREQMEEWVKDFNSWDLCDQCCSNLFDRTSYSWEKAKEWSGRREESVKRAGFVLIAALAVHDKKAPDERFLPFFPLIVLESKDDRNFVRKAVDWVLRQTGKRSIMLNARAIGTAQELSGSDNPAARWTGAECIERTDKQSSAGETPEN